MARHVLIVDDNQGIRLGVRLYLEASGFDVVEAGDCASALREIRAKPFDVGILDYALPDGTALDLLQQLPAFQPHMKVVVLTAYPSPTLAAETRARGAARFLTKPVDLGDLRQVIETLLDPPAEEPQAADK